MVLVILGQEKSKNMLQRIDPIILKKLANKVRKGEKYVREQVSKKASAAHVDSSAYLVFWANRVGIHTARYFATLDPHIQEQVRSLAAIPVVDHTQSTLTTPKKIHKVPNKKVGRPNYVDLGRLHELRSLRITQFDLKRLIKMCEELNHCFKRGDSIATIALVRSILNHVPPIFKNGKFDEVCKNSSIAESNRGSLDFLNSHSRKIADAYLHILIRKSETLPTPTQVDFSQSLDVLLGEIVRVLRLIKK